MNLAPDAVPWMDDLARHFNLDHDEAMMEATFRQLAKGLVMRGDGFGELQLLEENASSLRELTACIAL